MASNLTFGIEIRAYDQTQAPLRSALGGFTGFAQKLNGLAAKSFGALKGGLSFLRDLRFGGGAVIQGLTAVARGIDQLIDRGSKMSVTRQSFESLTKAMPHQAAVLAKSFVDASNGTLTLRRAMELTNRAIASGINVTRDLPTILDFASKKAITTGTSFDTASEQLITGLARMSAAWLDNFGILNDGLDGVKRTFDSLNGKGAFEGLTPAAQKAEFIRQAMMDIARQQKQIGISGRETAFQYARIKNHVTNAVDGLSEAIAASDSFRTALESVNVVIEGIKEHISGNGSFWQIFLGKGKSGGLVGIIGGVFEDMGMLAARGFIKVFQSTIDSITGLLTKAGIGGDAAALASSGGGAGGDATPWRFKVGNFLIESSLPRWWQLWKKGAGLGSDLGDGGNGGPGEIGGIPFPSGGGFGEPSAGVFPATWRAVQRFRNDFAQNPRDASGKVIPPWLLDRVKDAPLTEKGVSDRLGERNLIDREIRKREAQARRDARVMAARQVQEARKAGYDIDREMVEKEIRDRLIDERTAELRNRRSKTEEEVARTYEWLMRRAGAKPKAGDAAAAQAQGGPGDFLDQLSKLAASEFREVKKLLQEAIATGEKIVKEVGSASESGEVKKLLRDVVSAGDSIARQLGNGARRLNLLGGRGP